VSSLETVSGAIFDWAATLFSLTVMSQQGLFALTNPLVTSGNIFGDDF
jgi:hypothetical protein